MVVLVVPTVQARMAALRLIPLAVEVEVVAARTAAPAPPVQQAQVLLAGSGGLQEMVLLGAPATAAVGAMAAVVAEATEAPSSIRIAQLVAEAVTEALVPGTGAMQL